MNKSISCSPIFICPTHSVVSMYLSPVLMHLAYADGMSAIWLDYTLAWTWLTRLPLETGGRVETLTLFRTWMHKGRIRVQLYLLLLWLGYLFRNVRGCSRGSASLTFLNVSSEGIAPNCEPLVYNTIMWCAWGHTFLCLPCATWGESKMWVDRLSFLCFVLFLFVCFSKAGWMLIKDEFPAGTDYWWWNVQMQMFVSVCALALWAAHWFSFGLFVIKHC